MIKFEMHNIQLRDGRMVRLRLAQPGDAALFKGYYDGLSAKSRDFMHGWTGLDPVRHGELLALKTRSSDHVAIVVSVATAAEKIIGYCWLDGLVGQPIPMLGIGINDDFHKTELGRILLRTILSLAKQAGISLVRLGVWTDNSRAMHLYRSVGFNDDPRMPTRDFDGRTELYMVAETGYSGPERPRQFPMARLDGTPHDIGKQYGTLFKTQIVNAMAVMGKQLGVPVDKAIAYASRSIPYCNDKATELMEEIGGIAEGTGLSLEEIFTLNASLDLILSHKRIDSAAPDCWTMALTGEATTDRKTYLTWTAEDSAQWFDLSVLLKIVPKSGIPCLVWTFAGFVGRPGMNAYLALAAAANVREDCGHGLPYPFICRKSLACTTTEEAVRVIGGYDRMAGMDYAIADKHGSIAVLETSASTVSQKQENPGWIATTGRWADERIPRLDALVREKWGSHELNSIRSLMSDHGPGNLCPHDGQLASLMSFIADIDERALWVAYGNACRNEYIRYYVEEKQA